MAAGPSAAALHAAAAALAQRGHLRRQRHRLRQGQRLDAGDAAPGGIDGWKAAVETCLGGLPSSKTNSLLLKMAIYG